MAEWLYGWQPPPARAGEVETRSAAAIIERILGHDDRPLAEARPVQRRIIANCRTYTTLTCALLRRIGVPARARCGFGTYFEPGEFVDHWVVEHWDTGRGRWVQLDAQLDDIQRRGDVVRDLAALNKVELLPWDSWGLLDEEFDEADGAAVAFVDEVALVSVVGELDRVRKLYETDERLRAPAMVTSMPTGQRHRLPELAG